MIPTIDRVVNTNKEIDSMNEKKGGVTAPTTTKHYTNTVLNLIKRMGFSALRTRDQMNDDVRNMCTWSRR